MKGGTVNMEIIFTENAGILIKCEKCSILIDTIQFWSSQYSKPLSNLLWSCILNNVGDFSDIEYIAATHNHPDHISIQHICSLFKRNSKIKLILPRSASREIAEDCMEMNQEYGEFLLQGGVEYLYFRTGHIGRQFREVENYCIIIKYNGIRILITGDAAVDYDRFELFEKMKFDLVVVTPLFFHDPIGRKILSTYNMKFLAINHIPKCGKERDMFLKMINYDLKKCSFCVENIIIIKQPMYRLGFKNI